MHGVGWARGWEWDKRAFAWPVEGLAVSMPSAVIIIYPGQFIGTAEQRRSV